MSDSTTDNITHLGATATEHDTAAYASESCETPASETSGDQTTVAAQQRDLQGFSDMAEEPQ